MIRINPSSKDVETFQYERINHPHPRVQIRMDVLWLKTNKLPHKQIAEIAGVSKNTVPRYLRMYNEGGIDKLREVNFYKPQSDLEQHTSTIEAYFKDHPPATMKEAMSIIEKLTGLKRSETQVRKFLKSIGLKRLKVGHVPSKADLDEQERFIDEELEPRLKEAESGERKIFFVDAAHFVLAPFLGYLWCFVRIFIKAPAGRQRFNVSGALDAITHELITITNDTYINACSFIGLLYKIANRRFSVPVTLVLDNARYQKCEIVWAVAKILNIELLYIPAYSPNLNLIERLWKFVKKKCLYSKYYPDFTTFKKAITDCLDNTGTKYKKELDSLMTLKFQRFKKEQFMN